MDIKPQIIIDTDPGVDDALALLLAVAAGLPIKAITTSYGNASIEDTTRNALTVLELLESNIPVYMGTSEPLVGVPYFATVHGNNGLGGYEKPLITSTQNITASQFFDVPQQSITLACLGPTTNLAIAIQKQKKILDSVQQLIILGGIVQGKGNTTQFAEFNVYNDPLALELSLTLPCQKILIPIDVCRKVQFTRNDFERINNPSLRQTIQSITDIYISYYIGSSKHGGFKGAVMYDVLVTAYIINPGLFTTKPAHIAVQTNQTERYGETIIDETKEPNCLVVTDTDSEGIKKLFFDTVNQWKK